MPQWYQKAHAIHNEFVRRANVKHGRLTSGEEIVRFLGLALAGEAGELANLIKKEWRGDTVPRQELIEEMADIRIYLEHLANAIGISLDEACDKKLDVVRRRLDDAA